MKYIKLKIELEEFPDRLYRILLVKENICLRELAVSILHSFHAAFEHSFIFVSGNKKYVPMSFYYYEQEEDELLVNEYNINDLENNFTLTYDLGCEYYFKCTKLDIVDMPSKIIAMIDEGRGAGIFENEKYNLIQYLETGEKGVYLPYNLKIKSYKDFDKYNLEKEAEWYHNSITKKVNTYIRDEEEFFGDDEFERSEVMVTEEAKKFSKKIFDLVLKSDKDINKEFERIIDEIKSTFGALCVNIDVDSKEGKEELIDIMKQFKPFDSFNE